MVTLKYKFIYLFRGMVWSGSKNLKKDGVIRPL